MPGVYLHAVESRLARQVHSVTEVLYQLHYLVLAQRACEGGGVEIEAAGGAHGHASAGGTVRHVAAVPQLDGSLGAVGVDGVRQFLQFRDDFLPHPELAVEGKA